MTTKRLTITVPVELSGQLDYVCQRLGVTKSGFVSEVLSQSLPDLVELVSLLPDSNEELDESGAKRLRGASAKYVSKQVEKLISGAV